MSDAVIPFTFVRLKTLVDGGLRIEVDVPEIYQSRAFEIFKTGADGALVRLREETGRGELVNGIPVFAGGGGVIIGEDMDRKGAASGPIENGTNLAEACEDPRPLKKRRVSETTIKAYDLCRDKEFHGFLTLAYKETEEGARQFILDHCGVRHRSEIDKSPESAKAFAAMVASFEKWKDGR